MKTTLRPASPQRHDALQESLVVGQLEVQPRELASRVGEVRGEEHELAEIRLHRATLALELGRLKPQPQGGGRALRQQEGAAVARFLRGVPGGLVSRFEPGVFRHLLGARLHFLQPGDVRRGLLEPRRKRPRTQTGAQAVHVPRGRCAALPSPTGTGARLRTTAALTPDTTKYSATVEGVRSSSSRWWTNPVAT